jgi:hypothetical protein
MSLESPNIPGLNDSFEQISGLPYFQQLQLQFTAHIRNPQQFSYHPENETPIEARRLKVYEELFFNNIQDFFSNLFPVCKQILGEARWNELVREYMVKHQAQTPLFHQLGEEFLLFLQTEYSPLETDPEFLLELAHYEWVELALAVSEEQSFIPKEQAEINLDNQYQLSPLAWLLAYEWPVHEVSADVQPTEKPNSATTLLVYRTEDSDGNEKVDFMNLTPLLYQWLAAFPEFDTAREALLSVTANLQIDETALFDFAQQTLQELQQLAILCKK